MSISWEELQSLELAAALVTSDSEDSSDDIDMTEKPEVGGWFPDELDLTVATEADLEGPEADCGEAGVEVKTFSVEFSSYNHFGYLIFLMSMCAAVGY